MRTIGRSLVVWALAIAAVGAAEVWETTPFLQWSDKDVEKVLTDSPWAGKAGLTHARPGANLGSVPDWKLVVAVRSALPVRQALVRSEVGAGGALQPQHEQLLAGGEGFYVIGLSGIPRSLAPQLQTVADAAVLRRRGKDPIAATQGSAVMVDQDGRPAAFHDPRTAPGLQIVPVLQRGGGGGARGGFAAAADTSGITATLVLGFPTADPITAADQEFDFTTQVGAYNVKKTFKLREMLFKGALAL